MGWTHQTRIEEEKEKKNEKKMKKYKREML